MAADPQDPRAVERGNDATRTLARIAELERRLAALQQRGASHLPGDLKLTARATAYVGFLLCDGSLLSRALYARLFDAIGTAFGAGDGSTTFAIPDLRGRAPVGATPSNADWPLSLPLGLAFGTSTHALTVAQLAQHAHVEQVTPTGGTSTGGPYVQAHLTGGGQTAQASANSTSNAGTGQAHPNAQPSLALNFLIKT